MWTSVNNLEEKKSDLYLRVLSVIEPPVGTASALNKQYGSGQERKVHVKLRQVSQRCE